jgi:NAD(P)-dependent dehydrogenase (short-subunit alcohol dehydrogenase family)
VNVNELEGRIAIVTGGAGGLGRGIAERFVAEGARVVIADLNADAGKELAESLGPAAVFHATDVSDPEEVRGLVEFSLQSFGGLHVMVNNAGVSGTMHRSFLDDDLADFSKVMGVNLLGVLAGTTHAARHMATAVGRDGEVGGGSIINVSSIGGVTAGRSMITYRASKAAVIHASKSAAIALAEYNIRVNCIAPGHIVTPLLASSVAGQADAAATVAATRQKMDATRPLQRAGTAADIAEAALYLASDRSAYVTGIVMPVDGGTTAGSTVNLDRLAQFQAPPG